MVNKDLAGFTWAAECFCIIPGTFFLLFWVSYVSCIFQRVYSDLYWIMF